ncbi:MAG: PilT protein domain protein [Thermotogales bacterium 46_20]|nr:MAG: PilT protein domain protein [Thermotogales bacterium 46_20]
MRIMVDSNTLISGIVFEGIERDLLRRIWQNEHTIVIAEYTLMEVDRVIGNKFPGSSRALENLLSILNAEIFPLPSAEDVKRHRDKIRDKHDISVIATAMAAKPNLFVTGDKNFFTSGVRSVSGL